MWACSQQRVPGARVPCAGVRGAQTGGVLHSAGAHTWCCVSLSASTHARPMLFMMAAVWEPWGKACGAGEGGVRRWQEDGGPICWWFEPIGAPARQAAGLLLLRTSTRKGAGGWPYRATPAAHSAATAAATAPCTAAPSSRGREGKTVAHAAAKEQERATMRAHPP